MYCCTKLNNVAMCSREKRELDAKGVVMTHSDMEAVETKALLIDLSLCNWILKILPFLNRLRNTFSNPHYLSLRTFLEGKH